LCKGNAFPAHSQNFCAIFYGKNEKDNYSDKWERKVSRDIKNKWKFSL
jgi:hypothetical protein